MTLEEHLQVIDDDFIYIGCDGGSGFFYIGKKDGALQDLDKLFNDFLSATQYRLDVSKSRLEAVKRLCVNEPKKYGRELARLPKYIKQLEGRLHSTPFSGRNVVDTYKRTVVEPLGTIIIIDGTAQGKYWTYNEFLEDKKL